MTHRAIWSYVSLTFSKDCYRFPFIYQSNINGKLIQLDSVEAMFIMKKEVFPDTPYGYPNPPLKFCNETREKGYEVYADPHVGLDPLRFESVYVWRTPS